MTEVPGPAGPPVRPSSLAIRGTRATPAGAADGLVKDSVDMAQIFEIPGTTAGWRPRQCPGALRFRRSPPGSPLPAHDPLTDRWPEYGTAAGLPQARVTAEPAACAARFRTRNRSQG